MDLQLLRRKFFELEYNVEAIGQHEQLPKLISQWENSVFQDQPSLGSDSRLHAHIRHHLPKPEPYQLLLLL